MGFCENINCGYWWRDEGEDYACCHYNDPWSAPCEDEEDDYEE